MYLPRIYDKKHTQSGVTAFYGLDCHRTAPVGWFFDAENVSSDEHPMLTVRPPRGILARPFATVDGATVYMGPVSDAVIIEDRLCAVEGRYLWIGNHADGYQRLDLGLTSGDKLLVPYSYYLCIWPDKVYVNVLDPEDRGSMVDAYALFGLSDIKVSVISRGGAKPSIVSETEPEGDPLEFEYLTLWYKPRVVHENEPDEPAALYRQMNVSPEDNGVLWQEIESYILVERGVGTGGILHKAVTEGEYIVLSGFNNANSTDDPSKKDLDFLNGPHLVNSVKIVPCGDAGETANFTVRGILQDAASYDFVNDVDYPNMGDNNLILVQRAVPDLQYAVSHEGRIYGCFRGISNISGEEVNEIYISAANDFRSFYRVTDTTSDPLVMSVAEPGAFRGAAVLRDAVVFFKNRKILRVGGDTPESFYYTATDGQGPSVGCERSLFVLGGRAYYMTPGAVYSYDGGSVSVISDRLGESIVSVLTAEASGYGWQYRLLVRMVDGTSRLLVYDTHLGLWHRETVPSSGIGAMADHDGGILCFGGNGTIHAMGAVGMPGVSVPADEMRIPWFWESGMIGLDSPEKKYILKVEARLYIEKGASVEMWIQYDSNPEWKPVWRAEAGQTRTVVSQMIPHRCDHMRVRMRGRGNVVLLGLFITEEKESGR